MALRRLLVRQRLVRLRYRRIHDLAVLPRTSGQFDDIALGVEPEIFDAMLEKAKAEGREVRGPVDHRFVRSIYFRDPNGYD